MRFFFKFFNNGKCSHRKFRINIVSTTVKLKNYKWGKKTDINQKQEVNGP